MRYNRYDVEIGLASMTFEFISEGPKGFIKKRVEYRVTANPNIFILSFGDVDAETNDMNDEVVSDNHDSMKVIATVASTVYLFTDKYPKAVVYAEGSNAVRTRLYRINLSNNLEELSEQFYVYGFIENVGWFTYEKNKDYSSFYVKRKKYQK